MTLRLTVIVAGLGLSLAVAGCSSAPGSVPPAGLADGSVDVADQPAQGCAQPTTWSTFWHTTRVSPAEAVEDTWVESLDLPEGTVALRFSGAAGPHAAASWTMRLGNPDGAEIWSYESAQLLTGPGGTENMPQAEVVRTGSDANHVYSWEATGVVAYSDVQIEAGTCKR